MRESEGKMWGGRLAVSFWSEPCVTSQGHKMNMLNGQAPSETAKLPQKEIFTHALLFSGLYGPCPGVAALLPEGVHDSAD